MHEHSRSKAIAQRYALVDSPVLRTLRAKHTVWSGPVYWKPGGTPFDEMVSDLKTIRSLGFQIVRFHELAPDYLGDGCWDTSRRDAWLDAAEQADIGVVNVCEIFDKPPAMLLQDFGVDADAFRHGWMDDPRHRDLIRTHMRAALEGIRGRTVATCILGEPHSVGVDIAETRDRADFAAWLTKQYADMDQLRDAWRIYSHERLAEDWDQAAALADVAVARAVNGITHSQKRYGAVRDLARYKADRELARARELAGIAHEIDPDAVIGIGSHQLFINQAKLGWDIGAWARTGDLHTTSIHLSWHFDLVKGEIDLPVWLQARMTRDALKSGFTSAFETTGGAVQFSGGYGNHMDAGLMRRLCLAYLAAGNPTMAFWTWNHRPGGWEQGEYGMIGLSGQPMPWAMEAGAIAQAMEAHRAELWEEPATATVGILESWETDALLLCEPERHDAEDGTPGDFHRGVASWHRRALVGAGRALTRARIDFEYLTLDEAMRGLAPCYDTLLCPWHRALSPDLLPRLRDFVEAGGRLVVDLQFGFCDPHGRLLPHGPDTPLAQLFGAWVEVIHDSRSGGPAWDGAPVSGFWADVGISTAEVLDTFDDGRPALLRQRIGAGEAILCALDPAKAACEPGVNWAETLIAQLCRHRAPDWHCNAEIAVRRVGKHADHFFLQNPGAARTVWVQTQTQYTGIIDVLSGETLSDGACFPARLPAGSALWLRAAKGELLVDEAPPRN